ncbi:DUF6443 domain-containing protein [Flavitalea sp. BT771]|uniref:DUF6443 domain-containing protein n=1 Tax=Flavitalea sp. BT771 TaxID=3063329 RepID=UPI0026E325AC|nr:DUF6443 domain-containing protein [Flavitalea sp. BT771]MDO6432930.1 DUF6443 domain-containing protein [Flavitalea sp. BT771]MDV6221794.1 DUF6443 domain-containing protein [Flavitalea sp. BT771]
MSSRLLIKRFGLLVFTCMRYALHAQVMPPAPYTNNLLTNYTREWNPRMPVQDPGGIIGSPASAVAVTTRYCDGLGRVIQTVDWQNSPKGRDRVTPVVYDMFGREQYKYLPFVSNNSYYSGDNPSDGNFKTDPFQQQAAFEAGQYPGEAYFYGRTDYEASPLNRVQASYAAGNSWVGAGRGISHQYLLNGLSDSVRVWRITATPGVLPATAAAFDVGQLYKNVTVDEAGHKLVEYKDKQGRLVLKKAQLSTTAGAGYTGWLSTYYVYDDLDNLRFIIPPKAVEWLIANNWNFAAAGGTGVAYELCFRYEYDMRNRMITKKDPGAAETRMVYDVRDRLVMTQDSVLRGQKKWQVFCYDALNRKDTVALMTDVSHYNDLAWHMAQAMTQPFYPATSGYPTEVVTQFYFDSYDWVAPWSPLLTATIDTTYKNNTTYFFTNYNTAPYYAVPMVQCPMVRGMPTGYRTKIIDTSQFLFFVPYYDDHGQMIGTKSTNYTNGLDQEWTQFNFSGVPLRKLLFHKKNSAHSEGHLIATKNFYDTTGRLLSIRKIMDGPEARIDTMMYDELGQLRAKYFANNLDSLVYDYNIRGWVTGINRKYLTGAVDNYFGMELGYDNSSSGITTYGSPQYNGNIAGMVWKSAGDGVRRKYDFSYDNADRLTGADFTQYNGSTFAPSTAIDFTMPKISYDANGNILSMTRQGTKIGGASAIDRLSYGYFPNSNRLKYVYDTANDANSMLADFHYNPAGKDTANTPDYVYDANGRLTGDNNKGISNIQYNFLNLPQKISMVRPDGSSRGNIVYKYDAQGIKWAKIVTDSTVNPVRTTTTMYLKEFQYRNDTIQFVSHEEGRTRYFWQHYLNGDSSFRMRFDYFEKDHLGNTRVILTDQRDTAQYVATMEAAYRTKENKLFYNIPATSYARSAASGYPADLAMTNPNDSVIRLGNNGQKTGPAIILKVMSGDKVTIGTNYYFNASGTAGSQQLNAQDLINSLANGILSLTGGSHGSFSDLTGATTPLTGALTSFINGNNITGGGKPNAYLNYMLLDNQLAYVSTAGQSGALQVATAGTNAGSLQSPLGTTINVKTSGYLYIYVSNASPTWDVFFDNLSVMHYAGPLAEENHYYPFGLTMAAISDKALKGGYGQNKYRYNRKELQSQEFSDGSGLEDYDYGTRFYDPTIARWATIDPLADKYPNWTPYAYCKDNPISFFDFEGADPTPAQYQSFFINYAVDLYQQAKSKGASTIGALTLVSQIALESGFATNPGALIHNNPYSLKPNGKMADFKDYSSATTAFFANLEKNWPTAMSALSQPSLSIDNLDKAYHTGKYEKLGKAYMVRDRVNNYDYADKILGTNRSLSQRFIKALDMEIASYDRSISANNKTMSEDFSQIVNLLASGDNDGAAKYVQDFNNKAKENTEFQNKSGILGGIGKELRQLY